jgi:hypothetical protein
MAPDRMDQARPVELERDSVDIQKGGSVIGEEH